MGRGYLIDSNILIEYMGDLLPKNTFSFVSKIIDEQFTISEINKIEVLGHNTVGKDVEDFINLADILELTESTLKSNN